MTTTPILRPARAVRIHCPVEPATLQALLAGRSDAIDTDPTLSRMLAVIRGDNPLGELGVYRGVVELSLGLESFIPTAEAHPVSGAAGSVSISPTVILTTYIADGAPEERVSAALGELMAAHPWETPVIEVVQVDLLARR